MERMEEMVQDGENDTGWRDCRLVQLTRVVEMISGPAKIWTAFSIPSLGCEQPRICRDWNVIYK
jgi:hypothetical protein